MSGNKINNNMQCLTSKLNDQMTVDNSIKISKLEQGQKDLGRNLDNFKNDTVSKFEELKHNTQRGFDSVSAQIKDLNNTMVQNQRIEQDHITQLEKEEQDLKTIILKQDARLKKVEDAVMELHDVNTRLRSIENRLDGTEKEVNTINGTIANYKKSHYQSKISIIIATISAVGAIIATIIGCVLK